MTESELLEAWELRLESLSPGEVIEDALTPMEYAGFLIFLGIRNFAPNPVSWAHDMAKEAHGSQDNRDRLPFWHAVRQYLRQALDSREVMA